LRIVRTLGQNRVQARQPFGECVTKFAEG